MIGETGDSCNIFTCQAIAPKLLCYRIAVIVKYNLIWSPQSFDNGFKQFGQIMFLKYCIFYFDFMSYILTPCMGQLLHH